jgi:hypothetical protein
MPYTVHAQKNSEYMSTGRPTAEEALERARELEASGWQVSIIDLNTGQTYSVSQFAARFGAAPESPSR